LAKCGTIATVPRNVVTLAPRFLVFPTRSNRETRRIVQAHVVARYRARVESDPDRIAMDFPKQMGGRAAKTEVVASLDQVAPRWRRVFVLYPTESALRDKGE
jgi:hypothetical protein